MTTSIPQSSELLLDRLDAVRRLARTLVRDAADADDLVQEAVANALARPRPVSGDPTGWIATVLRNLARDRARSGIRRDHREREVARPEAEGDAPATLARLERHQELVDEVTGLDEPYRTAIYLRFF